MPELVYRYGLHAPHEGVDVLKDQLHRAHRYRNMLVEIERARRLAVHMVEQEAGDLVAARQTLAKATATEEAIADAVRKHRAKSRKRDEPAELRASLLVARAARKEASALARQVRQAVKTSPAAQAARDAIGERAKGLAKAAYAESGVYWGQRALVDEAASNSFSDTPMYNSAHELTLPRFEGSSGNGAFGLQIMGGLDAEKLHGCQDTRLRLRAPDPCAWSGARSDRRRYGSSAELSLRVGSDGRAPVWARWVCDMERPLPQGARVLYATVHRVMRGPHSEWSLCLTLDVPAGAYARGGGKVPTVGGAVAVDVGWRVMGDASGDRTRDELRVCGWQDETGARGELRLTAAQLAQLHLPEEIRSERDTLFEIARDRLAKVVEIAAKKPEWVDKTLRQWKSQARLAALCQRWPEESQGAVLDAAYRDLCVWYYRDRHLWEVETSRRPQALLMRREIYRIFAADLARRYETIVVEQFDKRSVAVLPTTGSEADRAQNETARSNRVVAATSVLVDSIAHAARSRCRAAVAMPAADTTRTCPACGLVENRPAEANIRLACDCGAVWDQDVDGAPAVLLARWRERPGDAKTLTGARFEEKPLGDGEVRESRWQRVARMRREKEARMDAARETVDNGAE